MYLVVGVHSDISEKICPCFILARFNRQHEIHLSLVLVQSGMANDPINLTGFELNFIISLTTTFLNILVLVSLSIVCTSSTLFGNFIPNLYPILRCLLLDNFINLCSVLNALGIHQSNAVSSKMLLDTEYFATSRVLVSLTSHSGNHEESPEFYSISRSHPFVDLLDL